MPGIRGRRLRDLCRRAALEGGNRLAGQARIGGFVSLAGPGAQDGRIGLEQQMVEGQPAHQLLLLRRADHRRRNREEEARLDALQRRGGFAVECVQQDAAGLMGLEEFYCGPARQIVNGR